MKKIQRRINKLQTIIDECLEKTDVPSAINWLHAKMELESLKKLTK